MHGQLSVLPRDGKVGRKAMSNERAVGKIPAVLFGKKLDSTSIWVDIKKVQKSFLHTGSVFGIEWEGHPWMGTIEEIQVHPVTHQVLHVSFHVVDKNEIIKTEVSVHLEGEIKIPGALTVIAKPTLHVKGRPSDIPDYISVNVDNMQLNDKIHLEDITLPAGLEWNETDLHETVISCKAVKYQEEETTVEVVEGEATEGAAGEATDANAEQVPTEEKKAG